MNDFARTRHAPLLLELAGTRSLAPSVLEHLTRYVELVVTWNKRLDLTAARGAQAQLEVLLADALVLADPELTPPGSRLIDVGSGAGAPGLALALARPDLQATLVEPLHKRVAFLRTVVGTLGCMQRVKLVHGKIEPTGAGPSERFDVALSRATFAPEVWTPLGARLATRTLTLVAAQATPPAPAGTELVREHAYALPWSHAPRRVAVYVSSSAEADAPRAPAAPE